MTEDCDPSRFILLRTWKTCSNYIGFIWPIILNSVQDASRLTTFYRKGIRKSDEPPQDMLLMKIMTVN